MTKRINCKLFSLVLIIALFSTGCSAQSGLNTDISSFTPMKVSADNCNYGGEIKSVEALSEFSVKFTLCTPDVAFPSKIASPIFAIQDKDYLDKYHGDLSQSLQKVNGTGPYTLESYNPNGDLKLVTSPTYWGIPPVSQSLTFRFMSTANKTPTIQEMSGVDAVVGLNYYHSIDANLRGFGNNLAHTPLGLVYLGFNNHFKPFDNLTVRQAFAKVIDRATLAKSTLPEGTVVANQMIPLSITPGRSATLTWYDLNQNDAIQALKNSGFDFNQELTLAYLDGRTEDIENSRAMAEEIQKELAAIQVKITLKPMAQPEFDKAMIDGSEMMFINHFRVLYPDGDAFYELPFVRLSSQFGEKYPTIINYLSEAQIETNLVARQKKFDDLNDEFKSLVPLIPIGNVPEESLFRGSVSNITVNGYFENLGDATTASNSLIILIPDRPNSLWPIDEDDYSTFRITRLLYDTLTSYDFKSTGLQSNLADSWTTNTNASEWTFALRYGVKFTNGATLDANDVVASFSAIWNAADENHKGDSGKFTIFKELFGSLLNAQ